MYKPSASVAVAMALVATAPDADRLDTEPVTVLINELD
jgi:hypothetical protein